MKVRLTEAQLKRAKLITEGNERVDTFLNKAEDIKEKVNRLYSKITYTTLAELLEGESDLGVYLQKLEQWRTVLYTHHKRASDFFQNMPEEEYYDKWEDLDTKVDDTFQEVVYHKVDVLEEIIEKLKDFAESDVEEKFKDIKKIDI
jgi:hypothetical protein